jgi:glycosyltransferase involved in cell wall biosynthesis
VSQTPVSIIIPAFNQLHYCKQCISSIQTNTAYPHKLILVDNGSTDGVAEYFDTVPDATVVHAETNRGFAGGVNLGLEQAEGHVLLLNSDTLVPTQWLTRQVTALDRDEHVGMLGPMSNYVSGPQQIDGLEFTALSEINAYADDLAQREAGQLVDAFRLVGFCLLIRDRVAETVGRFDESYGIGNFEDDDYCLRVRRAGYRLCIARDCFVFHYGHRTFLGMGITGDRWSGLIAENQERFREKWDLKPADRTEAAQQSQALNAEARAAFEAGDSTKALRLLNEAIRVFPRFEANFNDLGAVLWQLGEHDRAYEQFVRAVKLRPAYTEARSNLRNAALALGRSAEVRDLLAGLS